MPAISLSANSRAKPAAKAARWNFLGSGEINSE